MHINIKIHFFNKCTLIFPYLILFCVAGICPVGICLGGICPDTILNCMIHYYVCNDKSAILWASGNYCWQLDLGIPLAHLAIGFKT